MLKHWWLVNGETGSKRRFNSFDEAKAAGLRAYNLLIARGKYAEDTYHLLRAGEWLSVSALATGRPAR